MCLYLNFASKEPDFLVFFKKLFLSSNSTGLVKVFVWPLAAFLLIFNPFQIYVFFKLVNSHL